MAMEQYFQGAMALNHSNREDVTSLEKWKSASAIVDGSENSQSGGFDCNICLDFVQDPVVTLCGHLYCWPCIYKWIHFQSLSAENLNQQQPQCPVCKAEVSKKTLVPLYGRGQSTKSSEGKAPNLGIIIPRRPPSPTCGAHTLITTTATSSSHPAQQLHHRSYPQQPQPYYPHPGSYAATPTLNLGGTTAANVFHPIIGMFGEMVFTRIFGNSETTLYTYPNSYNLAGSSSPRVRRHLMQTDESLSRVCFFLCCCVILCLLLF
ncbi:hypothetical protein F0562_008406 [Nyssa sinensis]|uniref:E3 ubiquitin-protein ligase RMA n=1 Tax=Nyssa sinensis TaxID=561372 RepID=A0A5J5AAP0_9ASTE|nr:hypothetical protein F0562_008406 [Nyssa sinensis]